MAKKDNVNYRNMSKHNLAKQGNGYKLNLNFGDLGDKLDVAQQALDSQVWTDVKKYMPRDSFHLIIQTNTLNAVTSRKVYMYAPNVDYGHYQHEGIVYVDPVYGYGGFFIEETGEWKSRKGVTKVKSNKKLKYSNPKATPKWGETAYKNHADEWVRVVKRAIGK